MKDDICGHTSVSAAAIRDRALVRKVAAAESEAGILTGVRFDDDGEWVVSVRFYPETSFFKQKRLASGAYGGPVPIDKRAFDAMRQIKL